MLFSVKLDISHAGRTRGGAVLALGLGFLLGCSRPSPEVASPPRPGPALASTHQAAPPVPSALAPAPTAAALPGLAGDEHLPEPWRARFRAWLASEIKPTYIAVIDSQVMSNAVSVVLQRRTQVDGVCLEGPSKLDLIEYEGAPELTREVAHFGDDCCPGTTCVRTSEGWNLRYLALLAAANWKELSQLVPAKRKLAWSINGGEEPTPKLSRKDVAAGRFKNAPNCGLLYNVPSCDELTPDGFTCRCDGGGYHVTYTWEREGDGFVLVSIAEDSH